MSVKVIFTLWSRGLGQIRQSSVWWNRHLNTPVNQAEQKKGGQTSRHPNQGGFDNGVIFDTFAQSNLKPQLCSVLSRMLYIRTHEWFISPWKYVKCNTPKINLFHISGSMLVEKFVSNQHMEFVKSWKLEKTASLTNIRKDLLKMRTTLLQITIISCNKENTKQILEQVWKL